MKTAKEMAAEAWLEDCRVYAFTPTEFRDFCQQHFHEVREYGFSIVDFNNSSFETVEKKEDEDKESICERYGHDLIGNSKNFIKECRRCGREFD